MVNRYKSLAVVTTHPIQYYAPIFKGLSEQGVKIKVFYTWGKSVLENKYDPGFGKVVEWDIPLLDGYDYTFVHNISSTPGSSSYRGINNPTLVSELKQWKPEAILVIGWSFKSHLQVLRHFKGKLPILFRGDSTLINQPPRFSFKKVARKLFLKWVYKHIDYALYVGSANKAYYKFFGVKEEQLFFAPHAIDNDRFSRQLTNEIHDWKNQLHIPNEAVVFLFAGKFETVKNIAFLIEAFIQLNKENTYLVLVGNGPLEQYLKSISKESKNIIFLDFQNQSKMPLVYQLADIFILPSLSETWGLAINEAMASGKAVVTNDNVGCAKDLIFNGDNGYIYKANDKSDLVEKLSILASSKSSIQKMGKQSAKIINTWNFDAIVNVIENILVKNSHTVNNTI